MNLEPTIAHDVLAISSSERAPILYDCQPGLTNYIGNFPSQESGSFRLVYAINICSIKYYLAEDTVGTRSN